MREILFRGKCVSDGHWVHGLLISIGGELSMIVSDNGLNRAYPVSSETVGQYTGLTDKNGKKIFEGDITKCEIGSTTTLHRVVFDNRNGNAYFGAAIDKYGTIEFCNLVPSTRFEVVGNIYDNPELLEVTE